MFPDEAPEALSVETRLPRSDRVMSIHEDEGRATVELAAIMTAASNPVSPGPSSPPLDQARMQDFVPPTRPSSTPFPQPEHRNVDILCPSCPAEDHMDIDEPESSVHPDTLAVAKPAATTLDDMPAEIHECILDHLFGFRVSPTSKSSVTRWGTALRHARRKELSELALVSRTWRAMIQERLYRHIKLKATVDSINNSIAHFADHPYLRPYVKHMEIWFPVFQPKYGPATSANPSMLPTVTPDGLTSATYVLPEDNCSLEEAFYFVNSTLPEVCVLTLEGGERLKAPMVKHWIHGGGRQAKSMPKLGSVRTLITKGQWNLIRGNEDFDAIISALPSLREWQGSYSRPKTKVIVTMGRILSRLPRGLTKLNMCVEGDYRREISCPAYVRKAATEVNFCARLAEAALGLEHLTYTGRICKGFFDRAAAMTNPRTTRLKSIDITVKNCCSPTNGPTDSASGITSLRFIQAFESLVLSAIRALGKLKAVEYLRIRFVDLGMFSPVFLLLITTSHLLLFHANLSRFLIRLSCPTAEPILPARRRLLHGGVEQRHRRRAEQCQAHCLL